jgi:hypothetical protein
MEEVYARVMQANDGRYIDGWKGAKLAEYV